MDAATQGMSAAEAKAFEEKMLKMSQVLESELHELEEQQTKLGVSLLCFFFNYRKERRLFSEGTAFLLLLSKRTSRILETSARLTRLGPV